MSTSNHEYLGHWGVEAGKVANAYQPSAHYHQPPPPSLGSVPTQQSHRRHCSLESSQPTTYEFSLVHARSQPHPIHPPLPTQRHGHLSHGPENPSLPWSTHSAGISYPPMHSQIPYTAPLQSDDDIPASSGSGRYSHHHNESLGMGDGPNTYYTYINQHSNPTQYIPNHYTHDSSAQHGSYMQPLTHSQHFCRPGEIPSSIITHITNEEHACDSRVVGGNFEASQSATIVPPAAPAPIPEVQPYPDPYLAGNIIPGTIELAPRERIVIASSSDLGIPDAERYGGSTGAIDDTDDLDYAIDGIQGRIFSGNDPNRHTHTCTRPSRLSTSSPVSSESESSPSSRLSDAATVSPTLSHSETDASLTPRTRSTNSLPVPIPVPNLIKKSRGRRVPTAASLGRRQSVDNGRHRSSRSYVCKVPGCGKCFARGEHLKRHVRSIHTYEKPHKCPYPGCGKDFSRHDNLGQHMRVHKDFTLPPGQTLQSLQS